MFAFNFWLVLLICFFQAQQKININLLYACILAFRLHTQHTHTHTVSNDCWWSRKEMRIRKKKGDQNEPPKTKIYLWEEENSPVWSLSLRNNQNVNSKLLCMHVAMAGMGWTTAFCAWTWTWKAIVERNHQHIHTAQHTAQHTAVPGEYVAHVHHTAQTRFAVV